MALRAHPVCPALPGHKRGSFTLNMKIGKIDRNLNHVSPFLSPVEITDDTPGAEEVQIR